MAVEMTRYRLSVPKADETVNKWIANQNNLSHSLRTLIRMHIVHFGMTDPTCLNLEDQGFLKGNAKSSDKSSKKTSQTEIKKTDNTVPLNKEPLETPLNDEEKVTDSAEKVFRKTDDIYEEKVLEETPEETSDKEIIQDEEDDDDVFVDVDAMFGR